MSEQVAQHQHYHYNNAHLFDSSVCWVLCAVCYPCVFSKRKSWIFQCCGNDDGSPKILNEYKCVRFQASKIIYYDLGMANISYEVLVLFFPLCMLFATKNERQTTRYHVWVYKPSCIERNLVDWKSHDGWKETTRTRWDDKWFLKCENEYMRAASTRTSTQNVVSEFCWRNGSQLRCARTISGTCCNVRSVAMGNKHNANHFTCCCFHKIVAAKLRTTSTAQCACRQLHGAGILIV